MTDWYCSVCNNQTILTIVAGTIICKSCLEKVAENNKNNDNSLKEDLKNAIIKENDIYE